MQDDWTGGYVTDIEYTWGMYPEMSPAMLNWVAAVSGHAPKSLDREFTYLELGCGNGVSTTVNAACHPKGRFYGVDFNPKHIENARNMARNGGVPNVTFLRRSFADLLEEKDLPRFDYIVYHGVLTWIDPDLQKAIHDIVDKKLEPGGMVYVSYNSYPGQALIEPVRRLMIEYAATVQGDTRKKVQASLAFVEKFLEINPKAFSHGERVKKLLDKLKKSPPNYIAHEYFNKAWYPFYFTEIARQMGEIGLTWCGSSSIGRNILELNLNEAQRKQINALPDPMLREHAKDYVLDEQFRRDVFIRASPVVAPKDPSKIPGLQDLRVGSFKNEKDVEREVRVPAGTVRFKKPFDDAMIARVTTGAPTMRELFADPALQERPPLGITQVVQLLMATRQTWPFAADIAISHDQLATIGPDTKFKIPLEFNRITISERIAGGPVRTLASPPAGTGIPLSMLEACILDGLANAGTEGAVAHADKELERRRRMLVINNKTVERGAPQVAALSEEYEKFKAGKLERFLKLGIIAIA